MPERHSWYWKASPWGGVEICDQREDSWAFKGDEHFILSRDEIQVVLQCIGMVKEFALDLPGPTRIVPDGQRLYFANRRRGFEHSTCGWIDEPYLEIIRVDEPPYKKQVSLGRRKCLAVACLSAELEAWLQSGSI